MSTGSMSEFEKISRYVAFAVFATVVNIATQECVIQFAPRPSITISIFAGTVTGFLVKYILDKHFVFQDAYSSAFNESKKISTYAALSVMTTLIFWGFELAAWWIWKTSFAKYAGAVTGLTIGYILKYLLDQRWVFREQTS